MLAVFLNLILLYLSVHNHFAFYQSSMTFSIQVTLLFDNKLFRGNRSTKVDAEDFTAFTSPNMAPLAELGIDIDGTHMQKNLS